MQLIKLLKLAILPILTIVCLSSCAHTPPNHKFDIQKCGEKVCMPLEDFSLLFDAYTEYYGVK